MTLLDARKAFEEARAEMMRRLELHIDAIAVLKSVSTEYARAEAMRDYERTKSEWMAAREEARTASRRYSDLKAGIGALH